MKTDEIRQLGTAELEHKLAELKEELFKLRFQAKSGKLEKPSRISEARRMIARILTIKRQTESVKDHDKK
ncbi:MAG: 50S ribosomal protein L29 [Candidatus Omnitrophota bacterium]|nr:50S ribosomal protein L29 [Candidatus Omnitrophota bacterium]